MVELLVGLPLAGSALGEHSANRLKESDIVANTDRFVMWDSEGKCLRQIGHCAQQTVLAVLQRKDVLLSSRKKRKPLGRRASQPA